MQRLLGWLSRTIARHPWRVAALSAGPCLLMSLAVAWVPLDLAFLSIMNPDDPLVARYFEVNDKLKLASQLPLLLEGPDEELQGAVDAVVPVLRAMPQVERVVAEVPTEWLEARAPWLVDRELFDDWVRLATHPDDTASAERLGEGLSAVEAEWRVAWCALRRERKEPVVEP